MEVAAAHLDDRAEAAVVGAASGGFHHVDLTAEQRVSRRGRGRPGSGAGADSTPAARRPVRRCGRSPLAFGRRARSRPPVRRRAPGPQQLAKRLLAFASDHAVDIRRTLRTPPAPGWDRSRPRRSEPRDEASGSTARCGVRSGVETSSPTCPTTSGRCSRTRRSTVSLTWDCARIEIGDGDMVVRIDVAGQGRQRAVRHPDRHRRHVLEGIRHREQEHVHGGPRADQAKRSCSRTPAREAGQAVSGSAVHREFSVVSAPARGMPKRI